MLLELESQASSCHCKYTRIIENRQWGTDGAVMVCEINEVNDRPVGKPQEQGVMNIAASFSLSKKPRLLIQ
jgi:hypothetical protein